MEVGVEAGLCVVATSTGAGMHHQRSDGGDENPALPGQIDVGEDQHGVAWNLTGRRTGQVRSTEFPRRGVLMTG